MESNRMDVANKLAGMYLEMKNDPDNIEKRAIYFEALADARLTDYYAVSDQVQHWKGYAAFCYSCAMSGEKPGSFKDFVAKSDQV